MNNPHRIHFMGIGGSGMSATAQIAKFRGFDVSGCDLQSDTPYLDKVKKAGIPILTGHSPDHLREVDLLCVTPAVFYQSQNSSEFLNAKSGSFVLPWQDFLGIYLHKDKSVICVAGTHGKSTTTSLAGLLLEAAGLDPTVEIGATVKTWHNNVRLGQGKYFISEADEFHDNFKSYHSDIIILTLVELDHPEYFKTVENMLVSYQNFIDNLKPGGTVIYNRDSPLTDRLRLPPGSMPYSLTDFPDNYVLSHPGNHNKLNALAIINLARVLQIPDEIVVDVLKNYSGLERRLDLLGEKNGIKVYDDYANHPSSYKATISTIKEMYPKNKIRVVIEPHTYSRLKALLPELPDAVKLADEIIVSGIYASRESDPGDFTGQDIVDAMHHPNAIYIPEFQNIVSYVTGHTTPVDVFLIMGSGDSYKLARQILTALP